METGYTAANTKFMSFHQLQREIKKGGEFFTFRFRIRW
jgi:hypothetical protein